MVLCPPGTNSGMRAAYRDAATRAVAAGWLPPPDGRIPVKWIRQERLADANVAVVTAEVDILTGQTVAIVESVMHPNIVRDIHGAPVRTALTDGKAGEEVTVG